MLNRHIHSEPWPYLYLLESCIYMHACSGEVSTVAEKGRAFYFHNFQKRSFPTMVISDYEYFSLPKFLDTGFSHPGMKALSAAPSKKRRGSLVLDVRLSST